MQSWTQKIFGLVALRDPRYMVLLIYYSHAQPTCRVAPYLSPAQSPLPLAISDAFLVISLRL